MDKPGTFATTFAGSPTAMIVGGGGGGGQDVRALTAEQGLALAQTLFSTSAIMKTDLGQPIILSVPPLLKMSVTDPVRVDTIDFTSKSIEISGETPIRAINLDDPDADHSITGLCEDSVAPQTSSINPSPVVAATVTSCAGGAVPLSGTAAGAADDAASLGELAGLSHTHTSTEVMSAKMLLSLTGKEWCASPDYSSLQGSAVSMATSLSTTLQTGLTGSFTMSGLSTQSDSNVSTSQHSKRTQRKQKPIASARQADLAAPVKTPSRGRGKARKVVEEEGGVTSLPAAGTTTTTVVATPLVTKRVRKPGTVRRKAVKVILDLGNGIVMVKRDLTRYCNHFPSKLTCAIHYKIQATVTP